MFNDTVMANISYGDESKTEMGRIREVARMAHAEEFILGMPKKYHTQIGERGARLSGGQKQRIAIARAMYKNPPILLLDEATSQLDSESEILVQEAIDRLMKGRTVLVVAHRLSTIQRATQIIVIERGRIVEAGCHQELIARNGYYKKYFDLQYNNVSDLK